MSPPPRRLPRVLFLDDDPSRAGVILRRFPQAIWVQTAEECVSCLEESWDEIHLDHDLGGDTHVDPESPDCGMSVVRWIVERPRPHLEPTLFVIHTRNANAACLMTTHLQASGYRVVARPFPLDSSPLRKRRPGGRFSVVHWLRRGLGI